MESTHTLTMSQACCEPESARERDWRERATLAEARVRIVEAQADLANLQRDQAHRRANDLQARLDAVQRSLQGRC